MWFDCLTPNSPYTDPYLNLTRETTNLYLYLCDLLGNFALQHSFRSHFYMLSSNISQRVASLLRTRDKHLKHGMLVHVVCERPRHADLHSSCLSLLSNMSKAKQPQFSQPLDEARRPESPPRTYSSRITPRQSSQFVMSGIF
jgi:hypothetical protein